MSFFSSIGKILRGTVGAAVSAAVPIIGPAIGQQIAQSAFKRPTGFAPPAVLPGAGAIPAGLPALGPAMRAGSAALGFLDLGVPGPGIFSSTGCPPGFHLDKKTRSRCVRNRSMNPLNGKAAMRAATRLVRAKKAWVKIDKALARAAPRRPAARRSPRHITGPQHT